MRKVVLLMHASLDGFIAGPNGEMDWILFDDELAEQAAKLVSEADTAMYGRITFTMMESYWPTAAEGPAASKHDVDHANWVNKARKIVFSRTLEHTNWQPTTIIRENIADEINNLKSQPGKNLLLIGSASIAHYFMEHELIDQYWISINPVLLGTGIPLFKNVKARSSLVLADAKTFKCGAVGLDYRRV